MTNYRCTFQVGFEKSIQFYLNYVLLCLEYNYKQYSMKKKNDEIVKNSIPFNEKCQHEMVTYRKLFLDNFQMSPELAVNCGRVYLIKNFF